MDPLNMSSASIENEQLLRDSIDTESNTAEEHELIEVESDKPSSSSSTQPIQVADTPTTHYKPLVSPQVTSYSKAVAICLVMYGHILVYRWWGLPVWLAPLFRVSTLSVGVFAFLSGYGLTKSIQKSGTDGFFSKRFTTIYIPFFVTTVCFTCLFRGSYQSLDNFTILLKYLSLYLDLASTIDGTMWFITFICSWYIIFYFVFRFIKNDHLRVIIITLIAIFAYYRFSQNTKYWRLWLVYSNQLFNIPLGVFFATYENNKYIQKFIKEKKINIPIMLVQTALIVILYWKVLYIGIQDYGTPHSNRFNTAQTVSNMLFGTWIPFLFTLYFNRSNVILDFLGGLSYEAYLLEGILIEMKYSKTRVEDGVLYFLITFACAYALKRVNQAAIQFTISTVSTISQKIAGILQRQSYHPLRFGTNRE
ncbi:hypothetical protein CYY_001650 [Polysphondylium violaceum]|uniref:Acyltransferase 3 domain-containing protein n=1 Tax=Polysphondylium violaceum TaxID=133409 RepID=A0A8J4PZF7_9MYCE|nr:hypothetical protein CYY_001650 [Polysphondylium violaceum]